MTRFHFRIFPRARPVVAIGVGTAALVLAGIPASAGPSAATTPPAASRSVGVGIAALPAAVVLERSAAALTRVHALVAVGSLRSGPNAIVFHVRSTGRGKDVAGTLTVRNGAKVLGPVRFVVVATTLYFESDAAFWSQEIRAATRLPAGLGATALAARLAGRWIEVTGAQAATFTRGFGGLTQPGAFGKSLLAGSGSFVKLTPRSLRGTRVLPIVSSSGGTVYIALSGPPLPVEVSGRAAVGSSSIVVAAVFAYPTHLRISAPSGALTIAQIDSTLAG